MKSPIIAFTLASLAIGYGLTSAPLITASTGEVSSKWRVELHVSGGFIGTRQRLILNSRGELQALDVRRGKKITMQIGKRQLLEIFQMMDRMIKTPQEQGLQKIPSHCADCLEYALMVDISGRRQSVSFDALHASTSPHGLLIGKLLLLLQQALNGSNKH